MTIVNKALGVVAPNVVFSRLARRREQARPRKLPRSNKGVEQAQTALRCCAVALALVARQAGAAQGARQRQRSRDQLAPDAARLRSSARQAVAAGPSATAWRNARLSYRPLQSASFCAILRVKAQLDQAA